MRKRLRKKLQKKHQLLLLRAAEGYFAWWAHKMDQFAHDQFTTRKP